MTRRGVKANIDLLRLPDTYITSENETATLKNVFPADKKKDFFLVMTSGLRFVSDKAHAVFPMVFIANMICFQDRVRLSMSLIIQSKCSLVRIPFCRRSSLTLQIFFSS